MCYTYNVNLMSNSLIITVANWFVYSAEDFIKSRIQHRNHLRPSSIVDSKGRRLSMSIFSALGMVNIAMLLYFVHAGIQVSLFLIHVMTHVMKLAPLAAV